MENYLDIHMKIELAVGYVNIGVLKSTVHITQSIRTSCIRLLIVSTHHKVEMCDFKS